MKILLVHTKNDFFQGKHKNNFSKKILATLSSIMKVNKNCIDDCS